MKEIWKIIDNYNDVYEVSNFGRVKNKVTNRILSQFLINSGYYCVSLHKNKKAKNHTTHSLVAESFIGKKPLGMEVCHLDGNKINNHFSNIKYVTHKENCSHRKIHGTEHLGEKRAVSKLKNKEVLCIYNSKETQDSIAKKFNVTRSLISLIRNGKIWNHLTKHINEVKS